VEFHAELSTFNDARADSGLRSDSTKQVQLQLVATPDATSSVDATAYASGSSDAPVLTAKAGSGNLAVNGAFRLSARLIVKIQGLATYDGAISGLESAVVAFNGRSTFSPYLLDGEFVTASANIEASNLPDTPLPANLPGVLKIRIEEGGRVDAELRGSCAAIEGNVAQYTATLSSSVHLVLKPTVEIDTPQGKLTAVMPDFTIAVDTTRPILVGSHVVSFGAAITEGSIAKVGHCELPAADGGASADATFLDAGRDAGADSDADAAVKPGTASDCMARAKGSADAYYACCNENSEGRAEFEKATLACTAPTCLSYCLADGGTRQKQLDCYASLPTSKTACKTEPCSRFYACMTGAL
jgi:hypothetical protein